MKDEEIFNVRKNTIYEWGFLTLRFSIWWTSWNLWS